MFGWHGSIAIVLVHCDQHLNSASSEVKQHILAQPTINIVDCSIVYGCMCIILFLVHCFMILIAVHAASIILIIASSTFSFSSLIAITLIKEIKD
jgi:hypothetical protein